MRAPARISAASAALALLAAACGFPPLERVPASSPGEAEDLAGSVTVDGIQVRPAAIRPGDRVTLRDPTPADPTQPAPLYYWDACDGAIAPGLASFGPETTWTAPERPGTYAVSVNVTNAPRDRPSRVLRLCVLGEGETSCPPEPTERPTLGAVKAAPDSFRQQQECQGSCTADVEAMVTATQALDYRWAVRRGEILGTGAKVRWHLPTVGCCTETFTAAVTACAAGGAAATGFTHVVVFPE